MKFGSVCSGIEAASVAWHPLGWSAAWFSEIEPFPCAVLAHHYPEVPNLGDMTQILALLELGEVEAPDLLCGGTPCQAFSVAGLRRSLDDARGNLSLTFCEIANAIDQQRRAAGAQPCIVFWENVPGVLNTKDNAFGCFLAGLAGEDDALQPPGGRWANAGVVLGPKRAVAWRTLDAQYFGLAQRRRRVFVVASAREGFDPVAVLFERDRLRRDSAPRRGEGEATAGCLAARAGRGFNGQEAHSDQLIVGRLGVTHSLRGEGFDASEDGTGRGTPLVPVLPFDTTQITSAANYSKPKPGDPCHPLAAGAHAPAVCIKGAAIGRKPEAGPQYGETLTEIAYTQNCVDVHGVLTPAMQVRRLTPRECERLQGFPDDYTLIPWRKKPASECPDGPRYKALGNSWAVPVVRWIGERIAFFAEGLV